MIIFIFSYLPFLRSKKDARTNCSDVFVFHFFDLIDTLIIRFFFPAAMDFVHNHCCASRTTGEHTVTNASGVLSYKNHIVSGCTYISRKTFCENCVNLSGVEFRLNVCVHLPDERLRHSVRLCHTLSRFLHLVGVNAASSRVYQSRKIQTRTYCI